jgi:hypothetical protein
MWLTVSDREGNKTLFAFSSLMKGNLFARDIVRGRSGWSPYNVAGADDLRAFLAGRPPRGDFLVAIDAKALDDPSYQVVKLTELIEAMQQGRDEMDYSTYVAPEPKEGTDRYESASEYDGEDETGD